MPRLLPAIHHPQLELGTTNSAFERHSLVITHHTQPAMLQDEVNHTARLGTPVYQIANKAELIILRAPVDERHQSIEAPVYVTDDDQGSFRTPSG